MKIPTIPKLKLGKFKKGNFYQGHKDPPEMIKPINRKGLKGEKSKLFYEFARAITE